MNPNILNMLNRYTCNTLQDYENALKEIIQEVTLLAFWRQNFFEKAAFYGGTALRILYGLDRFSEDLDFSLLQTDSHFDLRAYTSAIEEELKNFGFTVKVEKKVKSLPSTIESAFLNAGTKQELLSIQAPPYLTNTIPHHQLLKIKIEVDINPPQDAEFETKLLLQPIPFYINTFQLPDLFAGKIHAVLARPWQKRIKGRDLYDFSWYISRQTPVRLKHLQARLVQSKHWPNTKTLTHSELLKLLKDKFSSIDFEDAKKDVLPFLKNDEALDIWSKKFFTDLSAHLKVI